MKRALILGLLALLLWPTLATATAPTKLESSQSPYYNATNNVSFCKTKLPNVSATGDSLFVWYEFGAGTGTPTVTDDKSQSWTVDKQQAASNNTLGIAHFFNSASGARVVTVMFPASVPNAQCGALFANNTNGGVDITFGAEPASTATWATGSGTTGTSGDFILQAYYCDNCPTSLGTPYTFTPGAGGTLLQPDGSSIFGAQYFNQSVAGAINPTVTSSVSATDALTVAVAYKTGSSGGSPGTGIYVNSVQKLNMPENLSPSGTTFTFNTPGAASNNLVVVPWQSNNTSNVTAISSSPANTWVCTAVTGPVGAGEEVAICYACNATVSQSMTITLTVAVTPSTTNVVNFGVYMISGAATSCFDTSVGNTATPAISSGTVSNMPTITTAQNNELVIAIANEDSETITGSTFGNMEAEDFGQYSGIWGDQDGGFLSGFVATAGSTNIGWVYSAYEAGAPNVSNMVAQAAAFKAPAAGGAPPSQLPVMGCCGQAFQREEEFTCKESKGCLRSRRHKPLSDSFLQL